MRCLQHSKHQLPHVWNSYQLHSTLGRNLFTVNWYRNRIQNVLGGIRWTSFSDLTQNSTSTHDMPILTCHKIEYTPVISKQKIVERKFSPNHQWVSQWVLEQLSRSWPVAFGECIKKTKTIHEIPNQVFCSCKNINCFQNRVSFEQHQVDLKQRILKK